MGKRRSRLLSASSRYSGPWSPWINQYESPTPPIATPTTIDSTRMRVAIVSRRSRVRTTMLLMSPAGCSCSEIVQHGSQNAGASGCSGTAEAQDARAPTLPGAPSAARPRLHADEGGAEEGGGDELADTRADRRQRRGGAGHRAQQADQHQLLHGGRGREDGTPRRLPGDDDALGGERHTVGHHRPGEGVEAEEGAGEPVLQEAGGGGDELRPHRAGAHRVPDDDQ